MLTKSGEREVLKLDAVQGGKGILQKESLLTPEQWGEHCGLFAEIVLEKGCTLGYHEHHGETETYYITEGSGLYYDNDTKYQVQKGDVVFCADGNGHGLDNNGNSDLKWIALILKK